jgi:hypothetical protein
MRICPAQTLLSLTALLLLPTLGCNKKSAPTAENYVNGLNAYFVDRTECLLPDTRFPFSTSDPAEIKRMETLVASQLLTESHETAIKVTRYVPTTLGEKYAPKFCYGHRVVTAIDSSTPPTVANGFNETQVTYRYKIADTPIWAKSAAVQSAFPAMAKITSGDATDKATLAQTRVGWQVPD